MQKASAIKLPRVTKILFIVKGGPELINIHGAHVAMVSVSEKLKLFSIDSDSKVHRTCFCRYSKLQDQLAAL